MKNVLTSHSAGVECSTCQSSFINCFYEEIESKIKDELQKRLINSGNQGRETEVNHQYRPLSGEESYWIDDILLLKVEWGMKNILIV